MCAQGIRRLFTFSLYAFVSVRTQQPEEQLQIISAKARRSHPCYLIKMSVFDVERPTVQVASHALSFVLCDANVRSNSPIGPKTVVVSAENMGLQKAWMHSWTPSNHRV
jgi:hypothetical protein